MGAGHQMELNPMASINRNDSSKNRRGVSGKGDFMSQDATEYRAGDVWGKSDCHGAQVVRVNGGNVCERCMQYCKKVVLLGSRTIKAVRFDENPSPCRVGK